MSNNEYVAKLAKKAYDAYRTASGGKSYYTGQPLPEYHAQPDAVKKFWEAAVVAVQEGLPPSTVEAPTTPVGAAVTAPENVGTDPDRTEGGVANGLGNESAACPAAAQSPGATNGDQAGYAVETGQCSAAKAA